MKPPPPHTQQHMLLSSRPPTPVFASQVLYTPLYFTRVWCMYELATWLHMIETGQKKANSVQLINVHIAEYVWHVTLVHVPTLVFFAACLQVRTPLHSALPRLAPPFTVFTFLHPPFSFAFMPALLVKVIVLSMAILCSRNLLAVYEPNWVTVVLILIA